MGRRVSPVTPKKSGGWNRGEDTQVTFRVNGAQERWSMLRTRATQASLEVFTETLKRRG